MDHSFVAGLMENLQDKASKVLKSSLLSPTLSVQNYIIFFGCACSILILAFFYFINKCVKIVDNFAFGRSRTSPFDWLVDLLFGSRCGSTVNLMFLRFLPLSNPCATLLQVRFLSPLSSTSV